MRSATVRWQETKLNNSSGKRRRHVRWWWSCPLGCQEHILVVKATWMTMMLVWQRLCHGSPVRFFLKYKLSILHISIYFLGAVWLSRDWCNHPALAPHSASSCCCTLSRRNNDFSPCFQWIQGQWTPLLVASVPMHKRDCSMHHTPCQKASLTMKFGFPWRRSKQNCKQDAATTPHIVDLGIIEGLRITHLYFSGKQFWRSIGNCGMLTGDFGNLQDIALRRERGRQSGEE